MKIKILVILITLMFLVLSSQASSVSVTRILEDDVRVEDGTMVHSLKAFDDLQNVTVIDYFSNISSDEVRVKESFLGREWYSIKVEVGDLGKGENRTVTYKILEGSGEALLGADLYFLDGEKHQLFPVKTVVDASTAVIVDEGEKQDIDGGTLLVLIALLIAAISILYLKPWRKP